MIFLVCVFVAADVLDDVAMGFWTGREMLNTRIQDMARTWMQLVPEIHIYTDEVSDERMREVLAQSSHLNIKFHILHTPSHELVGTQYYHPWGIAQDRHMAAVSDLAEREPNKTWYFFGDDDTYAFPENLKMFIAQKDPNDLRIYGQTWGAWSRAHVIFPKDRSKEFAQGGAGVLIGRKMMSELRPHLRKCREVFRTGVAASDMILAACVVRYVKDRAYAGTNEFYGNVPWEKARLWKSLEVTLHHVVSSNVQQVANAHMSVWKAANGTDLYVDWSHLSLVEFIAPVGEANRLCRVMWGYRIYDDVTNPTARNAMRSGNWTDCIEPPVPEFDHAGQVQRYRQRFNHSVIFKYICDANLSRGEIVFDSLLPPYGGYGSVFRVFCPKPQQFIHNHAGGSPLSVTREPINDF